MALPEPAFLGHDPRSGALLLGDAPRGMASVYVWREEALEATSSPFDTSVTGETSLGVRAFADGAWVFGYTTVSRTTATGWETFGAEACGGAEGDGFFLIDALDASEAWAVAVGSGPMTLCHFAAGAWSTEPIDFFFTARAIVGDRLLAFHDDRVSARPLEGGVWTEIPLGSVLDFRPVPEGVVVVSSLSPTETLILPSGSEDLLDGTLVGFGTDRWSAEVQTSSGEDCPAVRFGMLSDCTYTYDWTQIVIGRNDGTQREVAHRTVIGEGAGGDVSFYALGPDRMAVWTNDGFFVTP